MVSTRISLSVGALILSLFCGTRRVVSASTKNVLFLVVDDLRPELGVYYDPNDRSSQTFPGISTPNIDSLASESLLLRNAFSQFAICSPSRSSYMTSRRPDTTRVYDKETYWRAAGGNFSTIPQYFKANNYTSVGMGKIFHEVTDYPTSWSNKYVYFKALKFGYNAKTVSWDAVTTQEESRKPLPDTQLKDQAVTVLNQLAQDSGTPFFLAVGFHKPHLPFTCPQEFFDLYPEADIGLVNNPDPPTNLPPEAWHKYSELIEYADISASGVTGEMGTTLPDSLAKELRRAYYACVSYIDSLIGEVLTELDRLGLKETTVVSLVGDHGWQLGEHGEWTKNTNFDVATKVPMMIRVPGQTDSGLVTDKLVELVDLFPTLVEATGLASISQCPESSSDNLTCTEGSSLMTLVSDVNAAWKDRVFTQMKADRTTMGYSMRTSEYRYTEWVQFRDGAPDWDNVKASELYDYALDPAENYNRANDTEYQDVVVVLSAHLRAGWFNVPAVQSNTTEENFNDSPSPSRASSLRSPFGDVSMQNIVKTAMDSIVSLMSFSLD